MFLARASFFKCRSLYTCYDSSRKHGFSFKLRSKLTFTSSRFLRGSRTFFSSGEAKGLWEPQPSDSLHHQRDSTSPGMSSQPRPIRGSRPVTPPLNSARSPHSPVSPKSLQPPACRHRDRSPSPMRGYLIPSPLPTRRTRTTSATARAAEGPAFSGVCKCFSRSKGHGFITPSDGGKDVFVHISDIEGEYVPVEGDEVSYKLCSIPPKHEKVQAVEVTITHLNPGTKHETWSGETVSS